MKMLILIVLCCVIMCGCSVKAMEVENDLFDRDKLYYVSQIEILEDTDQKGDNIWVDDTEITSQSMNGIWVSQFDMHHIYRDGSKQRDKQDYSAKVETMMVNLEKDGFNTVFLQLRPNGDSMYESEIYPLSKYIAGNYGGEIDYDAVEIFLEIAKEHGISVHAWINPFRLCKEKELLSYGKGQIYQWYCEGIGNRIEIGDDGILYLDPSYEEATAMIVSGAREILERYDFDGIHLDDYFYPTEFEFDDEREFLRSGFDSRSDFRIQNIDRTVTELYNTVHEFDKIFGISPAGNIYSLEEGWYVDIYKWCSSTGYVDYIIPQLYFGFDNGTCPFETILKDWSDAVTNEDIKLYIGLSAAKCALGSEGIADEYAGEKGKFEWRDNKDILARSAEAINDYENTDGFCIFTYSSFYDPLTGEENPLTTEEKAAFCETMKGS